MNTVQRRCRGAQRLYSRALRTAARIAGCCLLLASFAGQGGGSNEPLFVFENGTENVIDAKAQQWHTQFEQNGDYWESWYFIAQMHDGGVLFAVASITNLGLRTFEGICDLSYHPPEGKTVSFHREFPRKEIRAAPDKLDLAIGTCRVSGHGRTTEFAVSDPEIDLQLAFAGTLPPYQFGNGTVYFHADRSAQWTLGITAPRAKVSGELRTHGMRLRLAGNGYHDHSWSTIKVPSMLRRWYTLRIFDRKYTPILHDQRFTDSFGGGENQFALLGVEDKIVAAPRAFSYVARKWHRDEASGLEIPTEFSLELSSNGYTVRGAVREQRLLESIDVLEHISWPIRILIKAFYAKPRLVRYIARYDLDITSPRGATEHISGTAPVEVNDYLGVGSSGSQQGAALGAGLALPVSAGP
jgi:hypothetical protein